MVRQAERLSDLVRGHAGDYMVEDLKSGILALESLLYDTHPLGEKWQKSHTHTYILYTYV